MALQFSIGDLKLHHLGTGGLISVVTYLATNFAFTYYGLNQEWLIFINLVAITVPTILGIHHKRNGNRIRHSTHVCLTTGHGIIFTIILNYAQEGLLPIIFENINKIG